MGATLANYLQEVNSASRFSSSNRHCMHRVHETSTGAKIYLATAGTQDGKCLAHHPHLIDVLEGYNNYTSSYINISIHNNLLIHAANLCKERDYLHKQVNITHMPSIHQWSNVVQLGTTLSR